MVIVPTSTAVQSVPSKSTSSSSFTSTLLLAVLDAAAASVMASWRELYVLASPLIVTSATASDTAACSAFVPSPSPSGWFPASSVTGSDCSVAVAVCSVPDSASVSAANAAAGSIVNSIHTVRMLAKSLFLIPKHSFSVI